MARHITTQRHRALDVLFEAEVKGILVPGLLRELLAERRSVSTAQVPIQDVGAQLVTLVADHLYELDETIDTLSKWGLRRLAFLDRNILRLGIAEVQHTDADLAEVIFEYTNLVRDLGGDKSIPFITAIFNRVADRSRSGATEPTDVSGPAEATAETDTEETEDQSVGTTEHTDEE